MQKQKSDTSGVIGEIQKLMKKLSQQKRAQSTKRDQFQNRLTTKLIPDSDQKPQPSTEQREPQKVTQPQ